MAGKKARVKVFLNKDSEIQRPSDKDIEFILRAADEIIGMAGRSMLAKILKGSKDKRVLEHNLQSCPSYGYYRSKTIPQITDIIDWMILNKYLRIIYNGRLPMIAFTELGWELYKPIYAYELIDMMVSKNIFIFAQLINQMKDVNREVVMLLLDIIVENNLTGTIKFLVKWEQNAYKKVAKMINYTLKQLGNGS